MYFAFDARTQELRESLLDFMDTHVHPNEKVFADQLAGLDDRWAWSTAPVLQELRAEARSRGLWNLFLPVGHYGDLGAGLTNLQYAPLAEITGRAGHLAPAALNCAAPDRIEIRPTVTMIIAKIDCPISGRINTRSMIRPRMALQTSAPASPNRMRGRFATQSSTAATGENIGSSPPISPIQPGCQEASQAGAQGWPGTITAKVK